MAYSGIWQKMKFADSARVFILIIMAAVLTACSKTTSEEHLQAAKEYIAQNNVDAATIELKNALQQNPESAEARFELGRLYLSQGDYESAEKELDRALEYGYPSSEIVPMLSEAYQRSGAYVALSNIDIDAELPPVEQAKVGYYKVQSLVQLDKNQEASLLIAELNELDTRSVYKGLTKSYQAIIDRDYPNALAQVQVLREQAPLNKDVLNLQAQLHLMLNQTAEATDVYQAYIEQTPDDPQTKFVVAKLLVDQGRTEEAEPLVDELLEINSENAMLNQFKGIIRAADNDFANGYKYSEKAIQNGRSDPVIRLVAGFSAYQLGDFESAAHNLSLIASSLPDNHPGLKLLAASQLQLGQGEQANDVLSRVDQLTEQDAPLFSRTGYELLRSGNVKQAREMVEKTSSISATADDLTRLGVLQLSMNDVQGIVNLESAVEKAPQSVTAQSTLATAYLATNQLDKALALSEKWKQTAPDDVRASLLAGQVMLRKQEFAAARSEFEGALAAHPDSNDAKMAMINLELVEGNEEQAEQSLTQLLAGQPDYPPALASYYVVKRSQQNGEEGLAPTKRAFEASPGDESLRFLLARMYGYEGQFEQSLALLDEVKADKQTAADFWQVKGQALLRTNDINKAELHYDQWLGFHPNNKAANLGKLLILDTKAEFAEGLSQTERMMEQMDDAQVNMLNTYFLVMNRKVKEGREAFESLPAEARDFPFMRGVLARLQLQENNPSEALGNAQVAYENSPGSRNMVLVLLCQESLGDTDGAFDFLQRHATQYPQDLQAQMLLAERQIGRSDTNAIATYEQALSLNEKNFVVLNNLAYLYLQQGDVKKARAHADRAVELQPQNAATLDTLAQVLVAEKDYDQALQYYDRIINDSMRNEEIYLNYVETLLLADQSALAKRKLDQREFELPQSLERVAALKQELGI